MSAIDWPELLASLEQQRTALDEERADIDAVIETVRRRAGPKVTVAALLKPSAPKHTKPSAKRAGLNGAAAHLSADQVATMRTQYEAGVPNAEIAQRLGVSLKAVYKRATKAGWKRRAIATPAPASPAGTQLSGSVKCTNPDCGSWTDFDPCRKCGKPLKRKF